MKGILGVDEVLLFVPNVQAAKHWYGELLGEYPEFDDEGYVAFRLGNVRVGLHPADDKNQAGVAGQVTYWRVSDLHETIEYFQSHGCRLYRGPILGVDQVWVCQLIDPFGNLWGLVQRPESR